MQLLRLPGHAGSMAAVLPALLLLDTVRGQNSTAANSTQVLTGFRPCDALIAANLSNILHLPSASDFDKLVNGSWSYGTQRAPWCFVQPSTAEEVSQTLVALASAGEGAGDWHIAIRSGGHGNDFQSNLLNGVTIDLTHLNGSTYDEATNLASVGTGSRWGDVYTDLAEEYGVGVTGGRQSIVGVGGLLLGGGVGWTTPRTGFGCDSVINYEVVLASGEIVNANASTHPDLWRALKGGSSNFGIVTRFDIDAFPASNVTLTRRTVSDQYTDDFIDAFVGFANLNESFHDNAMVAVIGFNVKSGVTMTVTEVNTVNDLNTTAFDAFNRIPVLQEANSGSLTLGAAAAVGAPELTVQQTVGAGPLTIANDPQVVHFVFQEHANLIADLNATLGAQNFSTLLEFQPLNAYWPEIGVQRGGNMLGLDRNPRNRLYLALSATLVSPESGAFYPQIYEKVAGAKQRIKAFSQSVGSAENFIYLPYADASQDPLGSYGAENVRFMKEVSKTYDPQGFFQRRVNGGFKLDRVT